MINKNRAILLSMLVSILSHIPVVVATEAVPSEDARQMMQADPEGQGSVVTSVFTTSIVDGKPADNLKTFENTTETVYFYSELKGMRGRTVTHQWKYGGRVMAKANLDVSSDSQAVWSSNKLEPNWTGFWVVEILDSDGQVIGVNSFAYNHPENLQMNPAANQKGDGPARGGVWVPGVRW